MIRQAGPTLTGQTVRASGTVAPQFLSRHALSSPDAIPFQPANDRERRALAALIRDGAVREVQGCFWLDLPRYRSVEAARERRRATIAIVLALVGAASAMLFY